MKTKDFKRAVNIVSSGLVESGVIEQSDKLVFINNHVVTFNGEMGISYPIDEITFKAAVNITGLTKLLAKIKNKNLRVYLDTNEQKGFVIKSGKTKVGIKYEDEIKLTYDSISKPKEWHSISDEFIKGLKYCNKIGDKNSLNHLASCVNITSEFIESSDRIQIGRVKYSDDIGVNALISLENIKDIIAVDPVEISWTEEWLHFRSTDKIIVSCRIVEDEYPDLSTYFDNVNKDNEILYDESFVESVIKYSQFMGADTTMQIKGDKKSAMIFGEDDEREFTENIKLDADSDFNFKVKPRLILNALPYYRSFILTDKYVYFENNNLQHIAMLMI